MLVGFAVAFITQRVYAWGYGIVLPDSAKDKPSRGTVIAIGDGRMLDSGERNKLQVKVGEKVLFTSYAPETIKLNDQELLLMREDDILGILA